MKLTQLQGFQVDEIKDSRQKHPKKNIMLKYVPTYLVIFTYDTQRYWLNFFCKKPEIIDFKEICIQTKVFNHKIVINDTVIQKRRNRFAVADI